MTGYVVYKGFGAENPQNLALNDRSPGYPRDCDGWEEQILSCVGRFENRIEDAVDSERLMPDSAAVLSTALRVGLCRIENSDLDAMDLVHRTWLDVGEERKLKEELLESIAGEVDSYSLEDNLEGLEAEELFEMHRKLRGTWTEG